MPGRRPPTPAVSVVEHRPSRAAALSWGGHELQLLPDKAAWIESQRTLLVADVHLGKSAAFRALGVPVPEDTTHDTLDRLGALVQRFDARRVVVLGDLLHSAHVVAAPTLETFVRWRRRHATLELMLVRGNHDDRAGDPPPQCGVEVVDDPWSIGELALGHHPRSIGGRDLLAGHLHPCLVLGGRVGDRLRLPCFHFSRDVGVLPAFGSFTGMHPVAMQPGDQVFVIANDRVERWPPVPRRADEPERADARPG